MEQVALLFTDIEGSTRLLERSPAGYAANLHQHHETLRREAGKFDGSEFLDAGDGLAFAFTTPDHAARAALAMQSALDSVVWFDPNLKPAVRIALHWTPAEFREGQYRGAGIHLISRLLAAGHGGQVLASQAFAGQVSEQPELRWVPLGSYRMRGFQGTEKIFQLEATGTSRSFPPLRADQARQHNLPASPGKFFGREAELAAIFRLFNEAGQRVIILTGTGGSGKSRLALAAGEQLLAPFDHGVYFVPLAELTDASAIPQALLSALTDKVQAQADPVPQIQEILNGARTVFILDNFEQFSAEGAAVMNRLLDSLESAVFLITSRTRIGISAEIEIALPPFPLPDAQEKRAEFLGEFACVQLFINAARKVAPERSFKGSEFFEIAEICRLVDGLPLALELVAVRINTLTTEELKNQLLLGLGNSDSTTRDRLEKTLEWSLRLLPPPVVRLLETLSVFRGGWTIHSAASVAGLSETLTQSYLHYLLICSLIQARAQANQMRFSMLIPLREFAETRLGTRKRAIYRRYCRFFSELTQQTLDKKSTEEGNRLQETVKMEAENILTGIRRERKPSQCAFEAVNAHSLFQHGVHNRALREILIETIPRVKRAHRYHRAIYWHTVAVLDAELGYDQSAYKYYRRAAKVLATCNRPRDVISIKFNMAIVARRLGKQAEEIEIYQEALTFCQNTGDQAGCATALHCIARYYFDRKAFEKAKIYFEECIMTSRACHSLDDLAAGLCGQGETLIELGKPEAAIPVLIESLQLKLKIGKHFALPHSFFALAKAALVKEKPQSAALLCGIAQNQCRINQIKMTDDYDDYVKAITAMSRKTLGDSQFEEFADLGAALPASKWLDYLQNEFTTKISQEDETHS